MKNRISLDLLREALIKSAEIRGLVQQAFHTFITMSDEVNDKFHKDTQEIDTQITNGVGGVADNITTLIENIMEGKL